MRIVVLVIAGAGMAVSGWAQEPAEKAFFEASMKFGLHRGGAHWRPEHTVKTYKEAWERWPGCLLEADVRMTKDGVAVLMHDETVDRTTDGTGPIAELTLEEVQQLDAGYTFTPDGGDTFPYRGKGYRVATLEEAFASAPGAHWLIEAKPQPGIAEAVAAVIRETGKEGDVLIASFDPAIMARLRELLPRAAMCYDFETAVPMMTALRAGGEAWEEYQPADDVLSLMQHMIGQFDMKPEEVERMQAKGIRTQLHTLNDEAALTMGIEWGFDGFLSDRPELMERVFRDHGLAVPGDESMQAANRE